jgi:putative transposase
MASHQISSLLARRCTCTAIGRASLLGCPKSYGGSLNPCCRSISDGRKWDVPAQICVPSPAVFFTCCALAASGRHFPHNLAVPVPFIAISKSGHAWVCGSDFGNGRCGSTIASKASLGAGKRSTARPPSRRWEGKKTGKNPTDRGKLGVKRSVLTDARGVPLGVAIAGANAHDQRLLRDTLRSIPIRRPSLRRVRQNLCLDKGYFGEPSTATAKRFRYIPHIRCRGEEQRRCRAGQKARRWVVEAAHSWTNRARRLLIRWEKKAANYLGFVHLQFGIIALRRSGIVG